ncbi:MAG: carboxypeptidase-like regulatory domain-containing protein [Bacteroidetes bacterium]|nr:carboxypeptidase-like regulatory domain-containing protein [Bacteroidota bacterium]
MATLSHKTGNWRIATTVVWFLFLSVVSFGQSPDVSLKKITGYVRFENRPFAGVNVQVLNTSRGMVTDERGFYEVESKKGETLRFSYIGFRNIEIVIEDVTSILNVDMYEEVNELEEVTISKTRKLEINKTLMGKPARMETNFGAVDVERAGYAVNHISGDKLNYAHEFLHRSLVGKIANYNLVNDIPPIVVLRGKNSINLDNSAIWEIDGIIYTDNAPLIDVSDVKDVFVIKGLAGTVKYGTLGAGGVIVVKTKLGDTKRNKDDTNEQDDKYTNKNIYQNDALPYSLYAQEEPFYLKTYDSLSSLAQAADVLGRAPYNLLIDPSYRLAVAQKLLQRFGSNVTAAQILQDTRDQNPDHPEWLKAIAYLWQADKQPQAALPIYRKLLALRPGYTQSYRDLAHTLTENSQYAQAWKTYLKFMEQRDTLSDNGIDKVVYEEMQNLFALHRHELHHIARMEKFDAKEVQQDVRLLFEWNVADAEFELEFVNPNLQVFSFNHTYRDNNPLLITEKKQGYSAESFFIDSLQGNWQVNLTYHGNGKYDPTYLKMTTFYNWGRANQRQETQTFRLLQTGMKFNLIKISHTRLASNE